MLCIVVVVVLTFLSLAYIILLSQFERQAPKKASVSATLTLLNYFSVGNKQPNAPLQSKKVVDLTKARTYTRGKKNLDAPPPPTTRKRGRPSKNSAIIHAKVRKLKEQVKTKASGVLAATPEKQHKWTRQVY